jgi:hypothetical protein
VIAIQDAQHVIDFRVRLMADRVKSQDGLQIVFFAPGDIALAHRTIGEQPLQPPAFDHGRRLVRVDGIGGLRDINGAFRRRRRNVRATGLAQEIALTDRMAIEAPLELALGHGRLGRSPARGAHGHGRQVPTALILADHAFAEEFVDDALGLAAWAEAHHWAAPAV